MSNEPSKKSSSWIVFALPPVVVGIVLSIVFRLDTIITFSSHNNNNSDNLSLMTAVESRITKSVTIYENILPETTIKELKPKCKEWEGTENTVMPWPLLPNNDQKIHQFTFIEQVLNDIIWQLYGQDYTSLNVEYWTRSRWYHTLAHADMDEGLRNEIEQQEQQEQQKQQQQEQKSGFAHPIKGHVLYLHVGTNVRGPTCIWLNKTFGGELLLQQQQQESSRNNNNNNNNNIDMVISPAVPNRLLQFQGDLLHAVPRPGDVWLQRRAIPYIHDPYHEFGRMVLLFNIWPGNYTLRGKPISQPKQEKNQQNDNNNVTNENDKNTAKTTTTTRTTMTLPLSSTKFCHDRSDWTTIPVIASKVSWWDILFTKIFEIPLMGNANRRGTESQSIILKTAMNGNKVQSALLESYQPYHVVLQQRN